MPTAADGWHHPQDGELWVLASEFRVLLQEMRDSCGSWRKLAAVSGKRIKTMYRMRSGTTKAFSYSNVESLINATGVGSVNDLTWYTADELVRMGVWKPTQYVARENRVKRIPERRT